jgi:hypothetical protein
MARAPSSLAPQLIGWRSRHRNVDDQQRGPAGPAGSDPLARSQGPEAAPRGAQDRCACVCAGRADPPSRSAPRTMAPQATQQLAPRARGVARCNGWLPRRARACPRSAAPAGQARAPARIPAAPLLHRRIRRVRSHRRLRRRLRRRRRRRRWLWQEGRPGSSRCHVHGCAGGPPGGSSAPGQGTGHGHEAQGHRGTGHRGTGLQGHRGTGAQGQRGKGAKGHRGTGAQGTGHRALHLP